ncbi:MAG: hypothetical protein QM581_04605 [Pseudomonas sp.]
MLNAAPIRSHTRIAVIGAADEGVVGTAITITTIITGTITPVRSVVFA